MGNRISEEEEEKEEEGEERLLIGVDVENMSEEEIEVAKFYKKQLIDIVTQIKAKFINCRIIDREIDRLSSVRDFNFKKMIEFNAHSSTISTSCKIIWEILKERYVDTSGKSLFPLYYAFNTSLKKESIINLAMRYNLSSEILKMIEDYPKQMIELCNSQTEWPMLYDLALLETEFSQNEIKLAEWLIKNTKKFSKNCFNKTFLETAITHMSPNFDILAELYLKLNIKWATIKVLEKTTLRKNLYRSILKYLTEEKLISKHYYNMVKDNRIADMSFKGRSRTFKCSKPLLLTHTQLQ
ncbi:unnamed protein product [Moneuplotes crassus]|uniref:Uncharacterized protein n=1 Tax=Euplotes crassus TaxID=5936 RepID=A0AAD1XQW1_EUPCR|nr:unnamed protein product [Moneuplotes crassus]